jgi:phosphonatase-like hydrolase
MSVQLVVFDMAGTTVHDGDAVRSCFVATLSNAGLSVAPDAINAVMGLRKIDALRQLVGTRLSEAQLHAMHDDFVARMRDYYAKSPVVREVAGASDVFKALNSAGVKVALNTGFSRSIVDVLLGRLGWKEGKDIDATVTSDEVAHGRPHPDMIQHLMRKLSVDDAHTVAKVGDTPSDLQEGVAAGCRWVIGITSGTHTRESLRAHTHTHLVAALKEIPPILGI